MNNSEANKNGALNIRQELEALRDHYKKAYRICEAQGCQNEANIYEGRVLDLDALLQRIPDGWELRPREPNDSMLSALYPRQLEDGTAEKPWLAMWGACKEEHSDE